MAIFSALQTRVQQNVIDLPSSVSANVPTYINSAIFTLQWMHNFRVMEMEKSYITSSTPGLGSSQTHIFGQIPSNWKAKRGQTYYVLQVGQVRGITWQPTREYMYRKWDPYDLNAVGPPRDMLLGEPTNDTVPDPSNPDNLLAVLNLEVFPYPDGNSDWPDGNYRIHLPYWGYLPSLVNVGDNNWFTLDGPPTEYIVAFASAEAFANNWDEQRATFWRNKAVGPWTGVGTQGLGGWARQVVDSDKGNVGMPSKTLTPRRDVYGPRDQWRT